ncbi:MAG: matrixin family metalloprotease [Bdellovibrionota bacterium]
MEKFATRYVVLLGATLAMFANFIACGAQMYRISMEGDFADEKIPPEAKDKKAPQFGIHALEGWKDLPIKFSLGKEITPVQKKGLLKAMKTWETAVGKQLFEFVGQDDRNGDSFDDLYSSLNDSVNGHYMDDNWNKTGKPQVVLATTIWDNYDQDTIDTADIRFNSNYYMILDSLDEEGIHLTSVNSDKGIVDMQSLALHELGHLLGLAHVSDEDDSYSIMNPSLYIGPGLTSRKLSYGDISRIQKIYGCEGETCDVAQLHLSMEQNEDLPPAKDAHANEESDDNQEEIGS